MQIYRKYNRTKTNTPKFRRFWCDSCDKMLALKSKKCWICEVKQLIKKRK